METIAITYWNNIVSPLYDAACKLMIAREGEHPVLMDIRELSLFERAGLCAEEGVRILICGAISSVAQAMLEDQGVRVVPWIRGPVDELMEACKQGADLKNAYAMPGCRRQTCSHRRRRRCGMQGR
ncbi:MAG: dinitrogenase iron-molybdenum cofactor biosynthesis protein [Chitinivibrionales bacterium]|nr:dinitrogenase iron-molybdenum cofactor biosynthesis protein [Chitinivibrionales bacterium]MBD3358487.1 dinitrogenase iron-molybdenum cofactor biosynthesis protein [Chitinivibrionales bacterium]